MMAAKRAGTDNKNQPTVDNLTIGSRFNILKLKSSLVHPKNEEL